MTRSARDFAQEKHGPQLYGTKPYVEHLDAVVAILRDHGHADETNAGYLHDLLEDTDTTAVELELVFGSTTSAIVDFCTDVPGANREARKAATYSRMAELIQLGAPWIPSAVRTKVADRLANVEASRRDNPSLAQMYSKEHETFRCTLFIPGCCDSMWQILDGYLSV